MRPLKLEKAFTLLEPGSLVLLATRDGGRTLDRRKLMADKLPPGI